MTTRIISIVPAEGERVAPTPKTIQLKRPITTTLNMADAPSRAASSGKGDTARIGETPTATRQPAPKGATAPLKGIQQRPPLERKSETIRISLADVLSPPQKPVDGKQVTMPITELMTVEAPVPPTIQLKRPPTSPMTITLEPGTVKAKTSPLEVPTATRPAADSGKKGTTRLILDAVATPMPGAESKYTTSPITVIPQTIRLKRSGSAPMAPPYQAKSRTDLIGKASTELRMPNLSQVKMTTSHILVEETAPARAPPAEGKRATAPITTIPSPLGAAPTPRTIRLKKPSSAGLEEIVAMEPATETPTVVKIKKAETAKIELSKEAAPIPITQRKTIKIRRTERNVAPRTVRLKHPGTIVAATPESALPEAIGEEQVLFEIDAPSPLFFAVAAAAVVLIACLVYIMASQAFGPELVLPVPSSLL